MLTIESDWDGQQREVNTTVLYTCSSGLETGAGVTEQSVNCTGAGWTQDAVMGCDGERDRSRDGVLSMVQPIT